MRSAHYLAIALLSAAAFAAQAATEAASAREYVIEPAPGWVSPSTPALAVSGAKEASDGVEYIGIDRQIRLTDRAAETYWHYVDRVVTEAGVKEVSTVNIEFDPHSEQIALHTLAVTRGGQEIDQLAVAHVSVLRRESQLEEDLLDGNLTLSIVLEDIRPQDVVSYSYTRRFYDSVIGPRFMDSFITQWSSPVRWSRIRLLRPAGRELRIEQVGNTVEPRVERRGEWLDTTWEWRDLPGIPSERGRPSWHLQYPRIRMTEWRDWAEVVDWAVPLYRPGALSPQMKEIIDEWSRSDGQADRIVLALRFVQDQVRYTGIEIGPGAYQPTEAARVFERRYGDCKDKVMLLVSLLRAMEIDARPALVHTDLRHELIDSLPSPYAFDHAIVRIRSGGKTYWFDATRTLQGGGLDTMVQARFGRALVIEPGVNALETIAEPTIEEPTTDVTETFDLKAGVAEKGTLTVTTIYRAADADNMRYELQRSTLEEIGRTYVDFYRDSYPGIKGHSPPAAKDDRAANRLEVKEVYDIEPAFEAQDDGSVRFELNPHTVASAASAPSDIHRSTPLAVRHPRHVRYKATVLLPQEWDAETWSKRIEDPAFVYQSNLTYRNRRLDASYEFRTLAGHVDAARVLEYAGKLEQVRDDAGYWFSHDGTARLPPVNALNLVALLAITMGLAGGLALMSYLTRRAPPITKPAPAAAPVGIGGWLLLPALQTCLVPVVMGVLAFSYWPYLNAHTWNEIGAGQGELAIQLLKLGHFVLISGVCALLVASCGELYLLFSRRPAYPVTYVVVTWSVILWTVLQSVVTSYMPDGDAEPTAKMIFEIIRDCFGAALWTAYMMKSARVAATFVRDATARAPVVAAQALIT